MDAPRDGQVRECKYDYVTIGADVKANYELSREFIG
jgi:hypothetical protein